MTTRKPCDVIPMFPEAEKQADLSGWDPYIFSIIANADAGHRSERRRVPRPLTPARRRALILSSEENRRE